MVVSAMVVSSINGIIAKDTKDNIDWSSKHDKEFFKNLTQRAGVVIFGRKTFSNIGKPLPGRLNIIMTRNPDKYNSENKKLFFTDKNPNNLLLYLERKKYEHVVIGGGRSIYTLFLNQRLVNDLYITFEPILLSEGIRMTDTLNNDIKLEKISTTELTPNSVVIHYRISYNNSSA
ncbi:MAG: dihydrofolate reductase family protein [Kosmotogaceae bacterium]